MDCAVVSDHAAKTQAFTSYTELLGAVVDTRWDFSLQEVCGSVVTKPLLMTPPCQLPSQSRRPNLCCVAWAGIALDGFGASFYTAAWDFIKPELEQLLCAFNNNEAEMERINRAYIVLLPKKPGVISPAKFLCEAHLEVPHK